MSKSQFVTAVRLAFGDELSSFEGLLSRLFDSFDYHRADKMDWRAFLFLLSTLMQPYLIAQDVLRSARRGAVMHRFSSRLLLALLDWVMRSTARWEV
jgi:hypothetical protein